MTGWLVLVVFSPLQCPPKFDSNPTGGQNTIKPRKCFESVSQTELPNRHLLTAGWKWTELWISQCPKIPPDTRLETGTLSRCCCCFLPRTVVVATTLPRWASSISAYFFFFFLKYTHSFSYFLSVKIDDENNYSDFFLMNQILLLRKVLSAKFTFYAVESPKTPRWQDPR